MPLTNIAVTQGDHLIMQWGIDITDEQLQRLITLFRESVEAIRGEYIEPVFKSKPSV